MALDRQGPRARHAGVQVVSPEVLEDGVGLHSGPGLFVRALAERLPRLDEQLAQREVSVVSAPIVSG